MSVRQSLFGELLVELNIATRGQVDEALARGPVTGERVGEALISLGYANRQQIQQALLRVFGVDDTPSDHRPPLGELLIGLRSASEDAVKSALAVQARTGQKLGEILVEQGSCTYAHIYEALDLQQRMGVAAKAPEGSDITRRRRLLVVDDSELICQVLQYNLESAGYEVHTFTRPLEALKALSTVRPDLIVSDLDMPDLNGVQLCRRIKSGSTSDIPVILLTGEDGDAARVTGLRAGADDFVNKAASGDELVARIESVLRRASATERVRQLFARYTSEAVVDQILAQGDVVLTGEKRTVTILFADLRDFTSLAESIPPEDVVNVLNAALGSLSDAVLTCRGTLDKYLGDGLMAVFGAPVAQEDDPLRAIQAARLMMLSMAKVNESLAKAYGSSVNAVPLRPLRLGVGINTGTVVAGNIGSSRRTEYTCIGDAVNVAARLCALAQPQEILVGSDTRALAGSVGTFERLDPVQLKGKARPVDVYRLNWST